MTFFAKIFLPIYLVVLICSSAFSQCSWHTFYSNSFESNAVLPYIIPGTTYQNTPQSYAVHTGQKSIYLNFVNNCAIGTMALEMPISVCPNVQTKFSAWFTTSFSGIQCKIRIEIVDSNNTVLQNVPNLTCPYAPQWVQFTSNAITSSTGVVKFRIYTNVAGGGGNDLSMDDLSVQNCHNVISNYPLVNIGSICSNSDTINLLNYFTNNPGTLGTWSGPSTLMNGSQGTFDPSSNLPGVYTYFSHPLGANPVCPTATNTAQISIINPIPVSIADSLSICLGDSVLLNATSTAASLTWSPNMGLSDTIGYSVYAKPISTTNYIVTEETSGCKGSDTTTVFIRNLPVVQVSSDTICPYAATNLLASGADFYTWSPATTLSSANGSTVIAAPTSTTTYMVVGEKDFCFDTAFANVTVTQLLNLTANNLTLCAGSAGQITANGALTYQWLPSAGLSNNTGAIVTASPLSSSTYQLFGNTGTCFDTINVLVTVNPLPAAPTILNQSALEFCEGDSVILYTNPQFGYLWSNGSTTPLITIYHTADVSLQVSDANGCVSPASSIVHVTSYVPPMPPLLIANGPLLLCGNDSLLITISSSIYNPSYTWFGTATPVSNDSLWLFANASLHAIQTDTNGCVSNNSNIINAQFAALPPPPSISALGSTSFCTGDSVQIQINGAYSNISWNNGLFGNSITAHQSGNLIATATDTCGITHQVGVLINAYPLPICNFSTTDSIGCVPFVTNFLNQCSNASSFVWNFGDANSSNDVSPTHEYLGAGEFTVSLLATSASGCKSSLTRTGYIQTQSKPNLSFAYLPDSVMIDNTTEFISFNANVLGADTFWWECADYQFADTGLNVAITMPDTGLHDVFLIGQSEFGCIDTVSRTIHVNGAFTIYIPNSFTPFNHDGLNDVFKPVANNLDANHFKCTIYDRWGKQLVEFQDPIKGWDGKINGELYSGIFNWIIYCLDNKGVQYHLTGDINVLP
jgi:gliding motility-associated-like protein